MFQTKNLTSKVALSLAALATVAFSSSSAFAQASTIFSDDFESGIGNWTVNQTITSGVVGAPTWSIDATPSTVLAGSPVPFAGAACLNYNNGTNYDDQGLQNAGFVTLNQSIAVGAYQNPELKFQQNWNTESGTYDQKRLQISNDNFATFLLNIDTGALTTAGTWTQVVQALDPTWGTIQIRFSFDTVDGVGNLTEGWFIDDFLIEGVSPANEDIAAISVAPQGSAFAGQLTNYDVTVTNIGTGGLVADGNVDVDVDGDGIFDATGSFTGLAAGGAQTVVTVSATTPGTVGNSGLAAAVTLTSGVDGNTANDTTSSSYNVLATDDVEVTSVSSAGAPIGSPLTINVDVTNNGLTAADGNVDVDIDNDGVVDATGNFTGLASGATVTVAVNSTSSGTPGTYTANATVILTSSVDADPNNDTGSTTYTVTPGCVIAYPAVETFDDPPWVSSTATPAFDPATGWEQDTADDFNWTIANFSPTSTATGPTQDFTKELTSGATTGNFLYTETSPTTTWNATASVISPCYDLSFLTAPELTFYYHMTGAAMGDLHIDVLDLSFGTTTTDVFVLSGQQQANEADPWEKATVSLASYVGNQVRIKFRGTTLGTFTSDMAFDQVKVGEVATDDVGITNLTVPSALLNPGDAVQIDVEVTNFGINPADFDVNVDWDGDGVDDGTLSGAGLTTGSAQTLTFNTIAPASGGVITVNASVTQTNGIDLEPLNDNASATYDVLPGCVTSYPYLETFDTWANGTILPVAGGWTKANGTTAAFTWLVDDLGTPSSPTGPNNDVTSQLGGGTGKYMFVETSSGVNGEVTKLLSRCFDLTSLASPTLKFYYHMFGTLIGDLHVDVVDTTGNVISTSIWNQNGAVQTSSDITVSPWESVKIGLGAYAGQSIKIQFRYIKNGGCCAGDAAIDHVSITEGSDDVAVTDVSLNGAASVGSSTTFDVSVYNFGINPADGTVDLDLDNDGVIDGSGTFTAIGAGATQVVQVSGTAPATIGNYTVVATANLTSAIDGDLSDNTGSGTYTVTPSEDVAITSVTAVDPVFAGTSMTIDVVIQNLGASPADGNVEVDIDGDTVADGTNSYSGLASGASTTVSVTATAPPTIGNFSADATVLLTSGIDGDPSNDTGSDAYTTVPTADVEILSVTTPAGLLNPGDPVAIEIIVRNNGLNVADIDLSVDYENDGVDDDLIQIVALASTASDTTIFNTIAPASGGVITVLGTALLTSDIDQVPTNNTETSLYDVLPGAVTSYPYLETFDNAPWTSSTITGPFPTATGWEQDTADGFDWTVANFSPTSTATGPTQDYTKEQTAGATTGNFLYTETSPTTTWNTTANAWSRTLDLTSLASPTLSFFYHMCGAAMGELHVDVLDGATNAVLATDVMTPLVGQQQALEADPWLKRKVGLGAFAGQTIKLQFRGETSGTFTSDMAFDQVQVTEGADDVAVTAVALNGAAPVGSTTNFDVSVYNFGINAADGTVDLDIDNDGISDGSANFTAIAAGGTQVVQVSATAPLAIGDYTAVATATLTSAIDGDLSDNSNSTVYTVTPNEDLAASNIVVGNAYSGMTTTFSADVTNNGASIADGNVEFDVDNDGIADGSGTFVGLASGLTETVTASIAAAVGNPFDIFTVNATVVLTSGVDGDPSNDVASSTYSLIPTDDVSAQNLTGPTAPVDGSTNNYDFELVNNGINPASGTFDFDVDTDGTPEIVAQAYGPIAPGDTLAIMVTATVPTPAAGAFTATVTQTLVGDGDPSNDSATLDYTIPLAGCGANSLTTTFASGNGSAGNMFDITAINDVNITCFEAHIDPGVADWEIWYITGGGTFVGNETSNANWTLAGSATGVPSASLAFDDGIPTQLPILVNVPIAAGATQGFYVTTTGPSLNYTDGTAVGNVFAQDANLQFKEGTGGSYFVVTIQTRIWNGNIIYDAGTPIGDVVLSIDGATLSWPAVTNANNYWVYQAANPNGPFTTSTSAGNVLTWTDPAGNASAEPFYYVTADTDPPVVPFTSNKKGNNSLANNSNYQIVITDEMLEEYKALEAQGLLDADVKTWLLSMYPNLFEAENLK